MMTERAEFLQQKRVSISCVIPAHNEADNIVNFIHDLQQKLTTLTKIFEIIVVDDGSSDNTVELICPLLSNLPLRILQLSRNFGKEAALTAGLAQVQSDVCILIDADFQHPLTTIDEFLEKWTQGYDMVYGTRRSRADESFLKRVFSRAFYRLMTCITKVKIPPNAGDFRLLDRKAVLALNALPERERFMKGLYAWIGFKSIAIPFSVQARKGGKSSWRFRNLLELAIIGITSFSNVPLRVSSFLGLIISLIAFLYGLMIVFKTLISGIDVPGYATIVVAIMFFGGIQLLSIGVLGEYIARIFNEVKQRPTYIIAHKLGFDKDD